MPKTETSSEIKALMDEIDGGIRAQRKLVLETAMNLAFLDGRQNVTADMKLGLQEVETDWNDEEIDNRMIKVYRWWLRKMFKTQPVLTLFGGGNEIIDDRRAKVGSKLMDYLKENNGWKEADVEAAQWVFNSGGAFIAPCWRSNVMRKGKRKKYKMSDEPVVEDKNGNEVVTFRPYSEEEFFESDIQFDVFSAAQVVALPLGVRRWKDVEAVISLDVVTKDWIEKHMGKAVGSKLVALKEGDDEYDRVAKVMQYIESDNGSGLETGADEVEKFLFIQKRERPTRSRPNGRYRVIAGGTTLHDDDLPYIQEAKDADPNGIYNLSMGIVPWFAMPFPGKLVPPAPATLLRPYQVRLNELRSDIAINRRTVGRSKLVMHEDALVDPDAWTNEHGEKVLIKSGFELPNITQGQPLQGVMQELAMEQNGFDSAAGRNDLMRGENPTQVRGAWHLQILYEEAVEDVSLDIAQREYCHQMVGRFVLAMVRRRYTTEQIIEIYGRERVGDVLAFMKSNVVRDFVIKEGSALPRNKAALEAQAIELWRDGAFRDEQGKPDVDALWTMLELGALNRSVTERQKHVLHANEEFDVMLYTGEVRMPEEWEPHQIHMTVFEARRAEPEFRNATVERKALINAHYGEHARMWQEMLAPKMLRGADIPAGVVGGARRQARQNAGGAGAALLGPSGSPVAGGGMNPTI